MLLEDLVLKNCNLNLGYIGLEDYNMIKLRTLVTAFIRNNNKVLLMERGKERKFAPGVWAAVGGHIEPNEINSPRIACLREIHEETGLLEKDLHDLELKYIILRKSELEIRIQYVYFGNTQQIKIHQTDEGQLFWIDESELFNRELTYTTRMLLKHYVEHGQNVQRILVGVVDECNGKPVMKWNGIEDWGTERLIKSH